jgi:hypothetical protein
MAEKQARDAYDSEPIEGQQRARCRVDKSGHTYCCNGCRKQHWMYCH